MDTADAAITPQGPHYGYVVSSLSVPASDKQVNEFGLDLGSKTSSQLDGTIDNVFGAALSTLAALGFDVQGTSTTAVDRGSILLLLDLQTTDFINAGATGFTVKFGANPVPPACSSATDTVCRHHLDGTALFGLAPNSPTDAPVGGQIVNGTFTGGPGDLTLQIAVSSTTPVQLKLLHARVRASSISQTGIMTANIGGLISQTEVNTELGPAMQVQFQAIVDRDCVGGGVPPGCGCAAGSTGATVISTFDGDLTNGADRDCKISTAEILGNSVVKSLLQPDSCSMETCTAADSLSFGVQLQAVQATFPL